MKISKDRVIPVKKQKPIPENTLTRDKKSPMIFYLCKKGFHGAARCMQMHLADPGNLAL
jgi:hypothetical protein